MNVDDIPGLGTAFRTANAVAASARGDHKEASRQLKKAGINAVGDAMGPGGKAAMKVAKAAYKASNR